MHVRWPNFFFRFLLPLSFFLLASAAVLSFSHARAQQPTATYKHGGLFVTIPYHSAQEGSGRLVVEILDPEDHVLGRAERTVEIARGDGSWQQAIVPEKPAPFEDIVWQRLRYRFEYSNDKLPAIEVVESISQILRRPVVHILGQTQYLAGSQAAIRVIVSDADNNDVAETGTLRIELLIPNQKSRPLFSGRLNHRGTLEAQFRFPADLIGKYEMRCVADTPIGSTEYTQPIQLEDKASILLTTEKPIYQPGQAIHVRALALDRSDYKAEADSKLTFELEDSRGNKVFKRSTSTDKFGIASAEFALADEVNLGTYHLRALMGEASSPSNTAEIALNVERYVLPKFKVAVEFAEKNNKPKRDYRPGEHVMGTVHANYFFGKPVDHADVTIKASSMDVSVFEAASATGKTDGDGVYHFDLQLPTYFAGRPLNQGAARALIEATVKDSASHAEIRGEPITISQSSLLITAVPEGGTLIPHLENEVFVLSSYPDGTPASASLTVHFPGTRDQQVSTDSGGVGVIHVKPGAGIEFLRVDADDHRGNRASSEVRLETRFGDDQILLRSNRAVFKAGDRIELKVLSTRTSGSAYVDIVKNGQTVVTRDLDLQNGQANLTLTATSEMAGTLDIDAYLFGHDAQPVADHRLVFIQPTDELKIETTADAAVYKPGSEARVRFHVTNSRGEGVSAALGLQVVDEAVFALAEKQPGFAKVFFYLEQEVMKPRYEIHSLSMSNVVEPVGSSPNDQQDLAARALFSATDMAAPTKLDKEFGRSLPQDKYADYARRYHTVFVDQVRQLAAQLSQDLEGQPGNDDIPTAFTNLNVESGSRPRDSWGTPFRIEPTGWGQGRNRFYRVRSAGPDCRFNTADDLAVYIEERSGSVVGQPGHGGSLDLKIEHDTGPWNERAEISGAVIDPTGAVISRATVKVHQISARNSRTAFTNAEGQFTLAALPAGRYEVEISSSGFESLSREFVLLPRDRVVLSATLFVGNTTETVTVDAEAMEVPRATMARGVGLAEAMPMAAPMRLAQSFAAGKVDNASADELSVNGRSFAALRKTEVPDAHVRSYFPEAPYINPEIITDGKGNADISIPIADSITTWRMAMLASTQTGALGTGTSSLKVFQDFFVDLDLPVTLTQGDRVSVPIAVYNYSGKPGEVSLKLQPEAWFSLDNDTPEKTLSVESGHVGGSQFALNANHIGKFKLTLSAHMNGRNGSEGREDIVVREIEVIPNGREQNLVFNGRLESSAQHDLNFPAASIPDATAIFVRLYPGPLSQVIEGMDSILRMPGGCFEQTSSSTYPNVLALEYMKRTKKLTPEVHAKAEGYIANGYQRLLTFEVPGGGFSWFGQAPANKILTAYGLMEFNDMSKVSDVDPKLIERTRDWLVRQQQPDGSWKPDTSFINEGATNRYNSNVLRITAYVAWSLVNTGYQGPAVEKAKHFIESSAGSKPDTYTLAVIANFAVDYGKDRDFTRQSMQALLDTRVEKDDQISWTVEETGVYSSGLSAAIETTGLATQALLKWGQAAESVRKAINFISAKKEASGNWGTTQATIMALRALLLASQLSTSDVRGSVQVFLDEKVVETLKLTAENNDLLHQFVFKGINGQKTANVQLKFEGTGGLAYQIVGRYFMPWDEKPIGEPLAIDVVYDRTKLAQNDIATATVTIRNNLSKTANMVMVDLGIPPGFDLLSEDLQSFQEKKAGDKAGRLEKFSLTSTQAILYFNALSPKQTVTLNFRLRAKYPIRARTFQSRVYEYYNPDINSTARPVQLEVRER
jgi:A-macroglobulin TED domain/Alpha-2-macroglobulin family/Carboxypeptidase regulatory-like domain/A-macroglobulin receptor binding domain/MG2 domain/Alpha-2-macroglobulin bait region domain